MSTNSISLPAGGSRLSKTFPMTISANAINKVREFAGGNDEFQGKSFRILIKDGGCAGLRYTFVFDHPQADDHQTTIDGVMIAIDPQSISYLRGSTVDYIETLDGAGFIVHNPNAGKTCGCGSSFGGC